MKIHFAVPGFSKCGTTSFCSLLNQHPDLYIPEIKETNFFSFHYARGWKWYQKFFVDAQKSQLCGEGSTPYSSLEYAATSCDRMLEHNSEMKFIFIARNPFKRLESSFRELHENGHIYGPYAMADFDFGECLRKQAGMIADSRYWEIINLYRERIPDHQIHVMFLENMKSDPRTELIRAFEFLEVEPDVSHVSFDQKLNSAAGKLKDTRFYRWMFSHRYFYPLLMKSGLRPDKKITRMLRLRVPFKESIEWAPDVKNLVLDQILEDSLNFLDHYGQPRSLWELDDTSLSQERKMVA